MGATLFVQDDRSPFSAETLIHTLHDFEITHICAAPTAFRQLVLKEKMDMITGVFKPKALECCFAAGEALNAYVAEIWKKNTGMDIYEGYGQVIRVIH